MAACAREAVAPLLVTSTIDGRRGKRVDNRDEMSSGSFEIKRK